MIRINSNIQDKPVSLYDPEGNYMGEIENYLQFLDVRIQIKKGGVSGYYIKDGDKKTVLDRYARYENPSLFESTGKMMATLIGMPDNENDARQCNIITNKILANYPLDKEY